MSALEHDVTITINGSEDAAVISGTTTGSVTEDGTLTSSGLLTISDTDTSDTPSFADVGVTAGDNNYGTFEMTGGTWTYTLNAGLAAVQALDAGDGRPCADFGGGGRVVVDGRETELVEGSPLERCPIGRLLR